MSGLEPNQTIISEKKPGDLLAGRYRIERELGRGGMGIVYLAQDREVGEPVALKLIPEVLARNDRAVAILRREAKNARKLSHPGICNVFNIEGSGSERFVVMEYIDGATLDDVLAERERLDEAAVIEIARQACEALAHAHGQGLVHRDMKPSNIMLISESGTKEDLFTSGSTAFTVKVTDFGLAREVQESMSRFSKGDTSGTLVYMSPEQLDGEDPDPRSDLYSLGCTLYELISGKPPFFRGDVYRQHKEKAPKEIEGLSPWLWSVLARCLAKKQEDRFESARALGAALKEGPERLEREKIEQAQWKKKEEVAARLKEEQEEKARREAERRKREAAEQARQEEEERKRQTAANASRPPPPPEPAAPGAPERRSLALPFFLMAVVVTVLFIVWMSTREKDRTEEMAKEPAKPVSSEPAESKSDIRYREFYERGVEKFSAKDYEGAKVAFDEARKAKDTEEVRGRLSEVEEAQRQAKKEADYAAYIQRGKDHLAEERWKEAKSVFESALSLFDRREARDGMALAKMESAKAKEGVRRATESLVDSREPIDSSKEYFVDRFSGNNLSQWKSLGNGGTYAVEDGWLTVTGEGSYPRQRFVKVESTAFSVYANKVIVLEYDWKVLSVRDQGALWLQDGNGTTIIEITDYRSEIGFYTPQSTEYYCPVKIGKIYRMKAVVDLRNGVADYYVDGKKAMNAVQLRGGRGPYIDKIKVILGAWGGDKYQVDNIVIKGE